MVDSLFSIHEGLATAGRIPALARNRERISALEMILLLFFGAAAATSSSFVEIGFRFPGHSIVLTMIPMALGLALSPRRFSGIIMGAGAFSTASIFHFSGVSHYGSGAFISLCLVGPAMDFALAKLRNGWKLYLGFILAGIGTNLLALVSRSTSKFFGLDVVARRPFGGWWTEAIFSYPLSGAIAGLIVALCFFQMRSQKAKSDTVDAGTLS